MHASTVTLGNVRFIFRDLPVLPKNLFVPIRPLAVTFSASTRIRATAHGRAVSLATKFTDEQRVAGGGF